MAAIAFLPWEKWIGRLLHILAIAIRKFLYKVQRQRTLAHSSGWSETLGTVESIQWDSSLPRDEIAYSFTTPQGSQCGYEWVWFDSPNERQPHVGDKIVVRYDEKNPSEPVFIRLC